MPYPLSIEMHVARVTVVWVSIENLMKQRIDNPPPGTPVDIRRAAPRAVSLRYNVDKRVRNGTRGQGIHLDIWAFHATANFMGLY